MKRIETFGNNKNKSMLIQSDNIEALRELKKTFAKKIDVITTDPPYNTDIGHIGYKDADYEDGWSKFIRERFEIAEKLLSPKGCMFIHIDENELCSLLKVCYDLFGKENVNILVWPKVDPKFDVNRVENPTHNIRSAHEYIILCYKDKMNTDFYNTGNGKAMESIVAGYGTTSSAKDEIEHLFGDRSVFSTPKPVDLIKEIIRIASDKKSIILDFFAGSGTAGHATMQLNKEDGGTRRFILVTNNENKICEEVTNKRLKLAIERFSFDEGYDYFIIN